MLVAGTVEVGAGYEAAGVDSISLCPDAAGKIEASEGAAGFQIAMLIA